ncbi:alpha/beta fold hydrolase [Labedaea rhizosphaerae]|uniref:Pimeloyl-ACP methyl ester carboxylesterase n=1 Tax=Labedaea rhizosphaerae TaxID=598644 RepID=A0A4R6S952_LABRH|nr:alpha/beta hydrolase [Labedaea rhizosphaerae]TDP96442.1 pimeloyl-ACP methyl ester carboxylesterase [Labedaea rhizosphaerae]
MSTIMLDSGTLHYEETGPADGRPVVFVHGYAMGGSLWRPLAQRLADRGMRCIVPTWPLGAHPEAMRPGADLTMSGVAGMITPLLDALDLDDVVLTGSDTGGALVQIVAGTQPDRVGALVLASCDAFEHFPPPILRPLIAAARSSRLFRMALLPMRTRTARRRAFGDLAHADLEDLTREWVQPALSDSAIADDLRRFTASMTQSVTLNAAARLPSFTKPALVAWSADDAFFPVEDGHRLAKTLPHARFELIKNARTFSMIDQPDVLADLISDFVRTGS